MESTRVDSLRKVNTYDFRSMVGDHPLVPLEKSETDILELEAQSFYLLDRSLKLHLVRPYLNMLTCPICSRRSTFCLDKFDRKKGTCILKSLEHGHSAPSSSITQAFRQVGLLPGSSPDLNSLE